MTLVKQVNNRKVDAHDHKLDITARDLRIFDIAQKDSDGLNIKPQDREHAKNLVINTLKINEPASHQPDPPAAGPSSKGYVHHGGNRTKHQITGKR